MTHQFTNYTDAERYRPYQDWTPDHIHALSERVAKSPWRANYHIEPETGLLNDPNGFSYFNGQWQLFYQHFPYGASHGLKSWRHLTSPDLVHWQDQGTKIYPDTGVDSHGAYSGSAWLQEDSLFIFYTGNVRDQNWQRLTFQNGAWLSKEGEITKEKKPLIKQPSQVTSDFRDPMVFAYQGQTYMVIGAQDASDLSGQVFLYQAKDNNLLDWQLIGPLHFTADTMGYMVECPNLVFLDGQPLLVFCPQGLDKAILDYQNIYPNCYVLADDLSISACCLEGAGAIHRLDDGFDLYASQAFNAPDGRALMVSWLGLPDIDYPSDQYGHQGTLSLVKELSLVNGQVYQYPVHETKAMRQAVESVAGLQALRDNTYELEVSLAANQQTQIIVFGNQDASQGLRIELDSQLGRVVVDRSQCGQLFAEEYGQVRESLVEAASPMTLNIFIDQSVFEIYINKGQKVISGRVFPGPGQNYIKLDQGQLWYLAL
ncbi:sucrose-6-phosphate hydrolase [Aerococcus urinaehominis]|uniref:Sucrose-6-phosphate hydrolase n=1 Tax=Aerococcus urinaehominis TaxID=128944 RepID=A0A0X8FLI8_9LACT|nr:sucrose-6-phosphate hydrolase [Aerococcus urinaehominis]AMB99538.1 sucrose-6-phosphate hydrolase [Aerococcus urinaehominis]SDM34364.1 beta-fructofuranosidase [Aerococcus urinaehominis]